MDMINAGLACFGAGEKSRYVRKLLEEHTNIKISHYVEDQIFGKIGTTFDGLEVISIYKLKKEYASGRIVGVIISTAYHRRTVLEIIKCCAELGIRDEDIYLVRHNTVCSGLPEDGQWIVPYKECAQIFDVNIHVVDHCNMKCELCTHSSQLVDEEVFIEFTEFCRDLDRLHELIPNVQRISLLGGEPFLHPHLQKFVKYSKQRYPYADIFVWTNATLLMQCSNALLECLRDNKVMLMISLYPPMHEQIDNLVEYIRRNKLSANINRIDRFFKVFSETPVYDPEETSGACGYCMALRHGKICRCPNALYTDYFNKKFGKILPETEGFDLFDEMLDPVKLVHDLERPMEICRYCGTLYQKTFEWKRISGNTKKEDILI